MTYLDIKVVDFVEEVLDFCFSFSGVKDQKFDVAGSHEHGYILLVDLKQKIRNGCEKHTPIKGQHCHQCYFPSILHNGGPKALPSGWREKSKFVIES